LSIEGYIFRSTGIITPGSIDKLNETCKRSRFCYKHHNQQPKAARVRSFVPSLARL
jgi:hypothetical protein